MSVESDRFSIRSLILTWREWLNGRTINQLIWLHAASSALCSILLFERWRRGLEKFSASETGRGGAREAGYASWIQGYYFPEHKFTLIAFVISLVLLAAVFLSLALQLQQKEQHKRRKLVIASICGALALSSAIFLARIFNVFVSPLEVLVLSAALTFSIFLPFIKNARIPKRHRNFSRVATGVILAQPALVCAFIAAGGMPIPSDYLQISSKTRVSQGDSAVYVDTIDFINDNRIWGNHLLPKVSTGGQDDPPCLTGNFLKLPSSVSLERFVRLNRDKFYFRRPSGELCFVGILPPSARDTLIGINPLHREEIETVSLLNKEIWASYSELPATVEFSRHYKLGLINFIHDLETVFHHHFQYLNPIKERALGAKLDEIDAPYGLGFLVVFGFMTTVGSLSYPTFIASMFALQLAYILALPATVHVLYRDWPSTLVVTMIAVGSWVGLGWTTIYTGLGYGPLRHALDIFVILIFANYLRNRNVSLILLAAGLSVANMFLDRFVGMFLPLALAATLSFRGVSGLTSRRNLELCSGVGLALICGISFIVLGKITALNPYSEQFLDGIWGFPVLSMQVMVFAALIAAALGAAMWSIDRAFSDRKFLSVFVTTYCTLFVFYWLIFPNYGHLYKVYPLAALSAVVLWRECFSGTASEKLSFQVRAGSIILSCIFLLHMERNFIITGLQYYSYFSTNQVYNWPFANMRVRSTIDPAPLETSVDLIKRATKPEERVSILSEYDVLLLFLAERVSGMKHYELGRYLNSRKHVDLAIADLKTRKPDILIVDTCLLCSFVPFEPRRRIPGIDPSYNLRALDKIDRLRQLSTVFLSVVNDYERVEAPFGSLVAIYRRKH